MNMNFQEKLTELRAPLNICEIYSWFRRMPKAELKQELNKVYTLTDQSIPGFIKQQTPLSVVAVDAEPSLLFLCLRFGGDPNIVLQDSELSRGVGTVLDVAGFASKCENETLAEKYVILKAQGAKRQNEL